MFDGRCLELKIAKRRLAEMGIKPVLESICAFDTEAGVLVL